MESIGVWQKLESNAYSNRNPFPIRPTKPRRISSKATPDEFSNHADLLENYDKELVKYRIELAHYHALSAVLEIEFKNDLESWYKVCNHPKKDLLYSKAYKAGPCLKDIATAYHDLVELLT